MRTELKGMLRKASAAHWKEDSGEFDFHIWMICGGLVLLLADISCTGFSSCLEPIWDALWTEVGGCQRL